jgi:hypothetical protein
MRLPIRSETDAFHLVSALAVLAAVSLLLGGLVDRLTGVVLFCVGDLQSRTHFATTDIDYETGQAHQRLHETLETARDTGCRQPEKSAIRSTRSPAWRTSFAVTASRG